MELKDRRFDDGIFCVSGKRRGHEKRPFRRVVSMAHSGLCAVNM